MSDEVRVASTPTVGAGREGVRVALAALIVKGLSTIVPPEIMPSMEVAVIAVVAMGFAWLGKVARDRGLPFIGTLL